jgi:hypothetical protein
MITLGTYPAIDRRLTATSFLTLITLTISQPSLSAIRTPEQIISPQGFNDLPVSAWSHVLSAGNFTSFTMVDNNISGRLALITGASSGYVLFILD